MRIDEVTNYRTERLEINRVKPRRHEDAAAAAQWEVDPAALRALCRHLGITWKVNIRRTAAKGRVGCANMTEANFGRAHNITVRKTKTPEEASRTIAHELTHAAQYEACGTWTHTVKEHRRQMRIPYARRPWEVEARGNEHLGDVFHPARPVSDV